MRLPRLNRTTLAKLLVIVVLMFGFGWAMVPIYRSICEITGVNYLTAREDGVNEAAKNTQVDLSRTVTVELDANGHGAWRFNPAVSHVAVHPGEITTVVYEIANLENRPMAGQAIASYAPSQSASHFHKLQCFCFTQQTLTANQVRQFPVVFYVDRDLPADVDRITLSYTFFEIPKAAALAAVPRA